MSTQDSTRTSWESHEIVYSKGVAIFHLSTSRVVICYDTYRKYHFLPRGRRDEGEEGRITAEREGWEESGYRNRLLPLPVDHRQPRAYTSVEGRPAFVVEPVITEMLDIKRMPRKPDLKYLVSWYVAETLPRGEEERLNGIMKERGNEAVPRPYVIPPAYPQELPFKNRIQMDEIDGKIYEPFRHEGTGVDSVEVNFISELMSVEEALQKLYRNEEKRVVELGWKYIQERWKTEGGIAPESKTS